MAEAARAGPDSSGCAEENARLKTKLAKAEAIIEVQGRVHALLEELSKSADSDQPET